MFFKRSQKKIFCGEGGSRVGWKGYESTVHWDEKDISLSWYFRAPSHTLYQWSESRTKLPARPLNFLSSKGREEEEEFFREAEKHHQKSALTNHHFSYFLTHYFRSLLQNCPKLAHEMFPNRNISAYRTIIIFLNFSIFGLKVIRLPS